MMRQVKIDLRPRCRRCNKIPRGKLNVANFERYAPYCSYHCQEWARLEDAQRYINTLPLLEPNTSEALKAQGWAPPGGAADAFEAGWCAAADWSGHDDLIADIGSPAYLADMRKAGVAPNAGLEARGAAASQRGTSDVE